ncbi:MAG TPA: hypothetical protein VLD59_18580 [Steroidobacteraceae bacterium]|nr:hypothetical protein [Steroidobacteraceae bacterium]
MRDFTLILTDLYFDQNAQPREGSRLPALETALARGDVADSRDWRAWVGQRIGLSFPPRIPVAAVARRADSPVNDASREGQWWLAGCVHLEAGVDRVYLDMEVPALSAAAWRELEHGFNLAFSASGFRLMDGADAQAYLLSAEHLDADTVDPARVRGADILPALPRGASAPALKRLMTEIQMWLHDHPVNIARQESGAPTLSGLWIWGGGTLPPKPPATLPSLRSEDAFLRGLWTMGGGEADPVPRSFQALDLARDVAMIVALTGAQSPTKSAAQVLSDLERDWFLPALAALRGGRIGRLQLHINDRLLLLTRWSSRRWWRRARPGFEALT